MPSKAQSALGKDVASKEMGQICTTTQSDQNVSLAEIGVYTDKQQDEYRGDEEQGVQFLGSLRRAV